MTNKQREAGDMSTDFTNVECTSNLYPLLTSRFHARSAVLDQVFVPDTKASILRRGPMASIIQGTHGAGSRVLLVGFTGDDIQADIGCHMSCPHYHE